MRGLSVSVPSVTEPLTFAAAGEAIAALQATVSEALSGRVGPRVLVAGAGRRTRFEVPPDAYVVGVGTGRVAMSHNEGLNERVVCDLAGYLPTAPFDLITCWYVLERVPDPAELLERFAAWCAPGGLVVLAVPHLFSPKSLVTKLTPHRFHVWCRRRMLGYPRAGTTGYGPCRTTLRPSIAPAAMIAMLSAHGLVPVMQGFFEGGRQAAFRRRVHLGGRLWRWSCAAVRLGSLGRLDAARSEYVLVVRKREQDAAGTS